jgi:hypothetical protein
MAARIIALLTASVLPMPAAAHYYYRLDGSIGYAPDEVIAFIAVVGGLVLIIAVIAACIDEVSSSTNVGSNSLDLPEELKAPESVEQYDDMAARTRALKRKLDADTELAESYLKAARTRAALDDIENESHQQASERR